MYRTFRTPSIWRELDHLQREMNRLFNGYSSSRMRIAPSYPAINIWVNEDGQVVSAEMPGVHVEDIDVSVEADTLTIRGTRRPEELPDEVSCHRQERKFGDFSRSIRLPFAVNAEQVEADFKNGVLTLTLPRTPADKPKKITIKS